MTNVNKKRPSITMTLLILIFVLPMVAAWLTYTKGMFLSRSKVHHGILLQPPLSISSLSLTDSQGANIPKPLHGKWALLYITDNASSKLSEHNLYFMRQIRQATGKNRDRIERAIITMKDNTLFDSWLQSHYPGTEHFIISRAKMGQFDSSLPKKLALEKGSLYLVDPLGNIMLYYAPNTAPKGILKDLERVLKVSQIG